jgi:hypothetical protein
MSWLVVESNYRKGWCEVKIHITDNTFSLIYSTWGDDFRYWKINQRRHMAFCCVSDCAGSVKSRNFVPNQRRHCSYLRQLITQDSMVRRFKNDMQSMWFLIKDDIAGLPQRHHTFLTAFRVHYTTVYTDCVPFELVASAALLWSKNCVGNKNSISKFDHHNIQYNDDTGRSLVSAIYSLDIYGLPLQVVIVTVIIFFNKKVKIV